MASVIFMELGFPIMLIDPPMIEIRGHLMPDFNMGQLQDTVFALLARKTARLSGSEVGFIRAYLRMRQVDFALLLNKANHSVVSQWEAKQDEPSGMDYNTEVLLRLIMATQAGMGDKLADLIAGGLRDLQPRADGPLEVRLPSAA